MSIHSANGLTAATTGVDARAICGVWNPHATKRIYLLEVAVFATAAPGAGAGFEIRRSTARGTTTAITPTADNAHERDTVNQAGWLLDITYSAEPTMVTPPLHTGFVFAAVAASGIILPLRRIAIPPGTGIVLCNRAAIIVPICEVGVVVEE